jgi:hypothetical protein
MRGDFTRLFNNRENGYSRLLLQQGRVLIDSDFNEAQDIIAQAVRTLAEVVIGPHGGEPGAFLISAAERETDFNIGRGRYYVQGVLTESTGDVTYLGQFDDERELPQGAYLAYLDVWEQQVTSLEEPGIREVALGGPDTATRARVRWQVRLMPMREPPQEETIEEWLAARAIPSTTALMRARTRPAEDEEDPCITAPDSRYRGAENQLYRVEIHAGNVDHDGQGIDREPTIKWSRENGSVVYPVEDGPDVSDDGTVTFTLAHLGRDDGRFGLSPGDWVEYLNDSYIRYEEAGPLLQVQMVDRVTRQVTAVAPEGTKFKTGSYPLLRRWDHKSEAEDGAVPVSACGPEGWLELEDHIEICFDVNAGDQYRTGDYWLIPARTVTGDIIGPRDENDKALPAAARGVTHYYAPLARISINGDGLAIEEQYRRCVRLAATENACP